MAADAYRGAARQLVNDMLLRERSGSESTPLTTESSTLWKPGYTGVSELKT